MMRDCDRSPCFQSKQTLLLFSVKSRKKCGNLLSKSLIDHQSFCLV